MPRVTEQRAECVVHTFKQGLLSAIAHDLEIRVERFSIEWDDARTRVEARFDPRSLKVAHAMKDGAPNRSALSERDKRKIESNIEDEVLETRRHPGEIVFTSSAIEPRGEGWAVRGTLALHGRSRAIDALVANDAGRWSAKVRLHQPDFGITPYSAMMGTLRIQPDVEVTVRVPSPG